MAKRKAAAVEVEPLIVTCRSCGVARPLDDYRVFSTAPLLYMDFCTPCERTVGTLTLYRRYNAYGTANIVDAVFTASRVPAARRTPEQVRLLIEGDTPTDNITKEALAERELKRRELCRRRLLYFTTTFHPDYKPGWPHQDICRRLERFMGQVERQESPRLMIFMPPRSGKSALASDMLPSWLLGHHPEWSIIASSYAQSLPIGFSRRIRDRVQSAEYKAIFPETVIRKDAQGVEDWKTTKDGGYIAAGVGTGITGKGFNVGMIDDPIKDDEEAQSEKIRDNIFNWYQSTFRTRAAPGAGILIILTRWHFDDPAGRLLEAEAALTKLGVPDYERENWEVVEYPAIAEHDEFLMKDGTIQLDVAGEQDVARLLRRKGEALHPERYPLRELQKIKNTLSSAIWNALYQQKPTPDDGDFFRREEFVYRWLDKAYYPLCRIFMCVDYAITKGQRKDWTVMGVYALTAQDDLYCLELRRGRWGTFEISKNAVELVEKYKPEIYAGERGQIHEAVWPVIKKDLDAKRLYISVDESLVPMQDKEVRARPLQGRMQRKKFIFSYDSSTRPEVYDVCEREMLQFPNGTHDDCVDTNAWAARLALNISLPRSQEPPKKLTSWKDQLTSSPTSDYMAA